MSLPRRYISGGGKPIDLFEPKNVTKHQHLDQEKYGSFYPVIDFTRPDALRIRAVHVEDRIFYVEDYYMSLWSQYFRNKIATETACGRQTDIVISDRRADHFQLFLECIYPMQTVINDANIEVILPMAYEYQVDGLLKRCIEYLMEAVLPFMDKVLIADRYGLEDLVTWCLAGATDVQINLSAPQYSLLSDRTKVRLLESLQGATGSMSSLSHKPSTIMKPADPAMFSSRSEMQFGTVCSKSGRIFYANPMYLAAWCGMFYEQVVSMNSSDLISPCTDEELVNFLLAIHPPLCDITDSNVAWILRASCKLECVGMTRLCAEHLLFNSEEVKVFDKMSLFDRCYLHELIEPCLWDITEVDVVLSLTKHQAFNSLSIKAKASMLDWTAQLLRLKPKPKGVTSGHVCKRCKLEVKCSELRQWVCPQCSYHTGMSKASNERK